MSVLPLVSVVVPVKASIHTLPGAVTALLAQRYEGGLEIILVGDPGDPSWQALGPLATAPQMRMLEIAVAPGGRDANAKRAAGLAAARGAVLVLTDSDVCLPPQWIATGVALLQAGWDCAAGSMVTRESGFWGAYTDAVLVGSKTPRMRRPYALDASSFGRWRRKPPTFANAVFTRRAFDIAGPPDISFRHSYEDYEWFWRLVAAGGRILCTSRLEAGHLHRSGWSVVLREYGRAGRGCADFICRHPASPLAHRRLLQLSLVGLAALALRYPLFSVPVACVILLTLGAANAWHTRRLTAFLYPMITLPLALAFSTGLTEGLVRHARNRISGLR